MQHIKIRQERESDATQVYEVVKNAFASAPFSDHDEHNLVTRLKTSHAFIPALSIVAELDSKIVGHILFTKITIGDKPALALAPVSVDPTHQSQGIGASLINAGHKVAKALGYRAIVVLGHEAYYPKFGYVKASAYKIAAPFDVPDENFMVLALSEDALKNYRGMVSYAPEFFEA